jgi:hypothetical protein
METVTDPGIEAIRRQLVELVLNDPDLFEAAFADVLAAWHASPPQRETTTRTRTRDRGHPTRSRRDIFPPRHEDGSLRADWLLRTARSPPTRPDPTYESE